MADDNIIIEGNVKFRDGKKWKSRWCVMRKLSPVADSIQLQLYRDARSRAAAASGVNVPGGGIKASLSLQQWAGSESGFTLDKHSNTLALLCADHTAVLAFDTRERLIQWQVKVAMHLGETRQFLVLVASSASRRIQPGPARLLLTAGRAALTGGVPPRLLATWHLQHLRRYGVVEGRLCLEGGAMCGEGRGAGLHVLVSEQASDIQRAFSLAAERGLSAPRRQTSHAGLESPKSHKAYRPGTRLSELNATERSLPPEDLRLYEDPGFGEQCLAPYWPSAERGLDMGLPDTASVHDLDAATEGRVSIARCSSCMSALGALSRSSTAALTPGARHFSPAWTMDALHEDNSDSVHNGCDSNVSAKRDVCRCDDPPSRPPKPNRLDLNLTRKPPMPSPVCGCSQLNLLEENSRVGPYENYDVPKIPSAEVDGEYYDTPKRLKECLNNELFRITKSSTPNSLILKKPCGCLLKFGKRRKEPVVVESEENVQPASCACRRVTDWANSWANNWIKLPGSYCKRNAHTQSDDSAKLNKENFKPDPSDRCALYATVDLSRKIRRKATCRACQDDVTPNVDRGLDPRRVEIDDGPLANYENLNFALSLEHYENAKDVLKRAGLTQAELNAISDNLNNPVSFTIKNGECVCTKCGHSQKNKDRNVTQEAIVSSTSDDYLMMEPNSLESNKFEPIGKSLPSGYTPMSPIGTFAFHTLRNPPKSPISKILDEKSASNPTLCAISKEHHTSIETVEVHEPHTKTEKERKKEFRKRSSSADSSRFLDDVKEFDSSVGSHGSTSSIETLRNIVLEDRTTPYADNKHSDSSEASKDLQERISALTKRCASVSGGKTSGNRDSSSSNDSGVSSCSLRRDFELPLTTSAARHHYRCALQGAPGVLSLPRRSKSTDPMRDFASLQRARVAPKSSSAEAEVPVLSIKPLRGVADSRSTSSGTSDMSDYIETMSLCSEHSHSSADAPFAVRAMRQTTSTLRPRSGKEYQPLGAHLVPLRAPPTLPPHPRAEPSPCHRNIRN